MAHPRGSAIAVILVLAASAGAARGEEVDLRAFGGLGIGAAVEGWVPGGQARIDVQAATTVVEGFGWAGVAGVVPLSGTRRRFVGARAGYTLEHLGMEGTYWTGSRYAHALDGDVVLHLEAAGGSAFETQLGFDGVLREEAASCCDNAALQTSSFGVRVMLRGELALSPVWAVYAEAGVRTADHVLEIKFLPTLWAGVRLRL
jgi:hypothetical protein